MKKFTSFFKYFSDSQAVIEGVFQKHKIRFTQPWGMNDPLEFNPTLYFQSFENPYQGYELDGVFLPSIELFYRVQLIESQMNSYGILSLTKQPFSFDMWSRYANGHKGFLIEFKPDFAHHSCMKSKDGSLYTIKKVEYVKKYFLDIEKLSDEDGRLFPEKLKEEVFYKKTSRWKYEKEYRLVRPFSDIPGYETKDNRPHRDESVYLFDFSLDCIKSVVFGACMSVKNKEYIAKECAKYNIELYQAYIIRNKHDALNSLGEVNFLSADSFPSIEHILEMKAYTFIHDLPNAEYGSLTKINKLNDLPYYKGNEEVMHSLYENLKRSNK